jgi:hypothetical protein
MGEVLQGVEKSSVLRELLRNGKQKCFLCKWILEDLEANQKLTGYPKDAMGAGIFPVNGKLIHVILELGSPAPQDYESQEDLASVVDHLLETVQASN